MSDSHLNKPLREPKPAERGLFWLLRSPRKTRLHIGALCDVLTAAGIDPNAWTPRELSETINRWMAGQNRAALGSTAKNPLRYFAWLLSQAVDPTAPTPRQRADKEAAVREAERAERARVAAEDKRRRESIDYDEVARILDEMKAAAAQARARARTRSRLRSSH